MILYLIIECRLASWLGLGRSARSAHSWAVRVAAYFRVKIILIIEGLSLFRV